MRLVALRCPNCSQPLTPEHEDVVVTCASCRSAVVIDDEGLGTIQVHYALPPGTNGNEVQRWLPFWVFSGHVRIDRRETQGGSRSAGRDSEAMWSAARQLYVPAWDLSLQTAQEVGSKLVQRQPQFEAVVRPEEAELSAATVTPADALKLLEFVVLAIEARRKDWLKDLAFRLDVGDPELWALPQDVAR